jgi:hypothetical protein
MSRSWSANWRSSEHGQELGRNVSEIEISVGALDSIAHRTFEDAGEMAAMGATLITLALSGPDYHISVVPDWLEWRDARNAGSNERA